MHEVTLVTEEYSKLHLQKPMVNATEHNKPKKKSTKSKSTTNFTVYIHIKAASRY